MSPVFVQLASLLVTAAEETTKAASDNALWVIAAGTVSHLIQNWRGFKTLGEKVANNYVPVEMYSAKVAQLHAEINELKLQLARLEGPKK